MEIINNENYITNKQLKNIIQLLGTEYKPNYIIIYETRSDVFKLGLKYPEIISELIFILLGKREGICARYNYRIDIFIFSENYDGNDKQTKQLYSIHTLLHELRHVYQLNNSKSIKTTNETDADIFATNFLNSHSKQLSKIMHWKDEWEVEEED